MSIAESYQAMSNDMRAAAKKIEHEDARRACLVLAELWSRAAQRANGFTVSIDASILDSIR